MQRASVDTTDPSHVKALDGTDYIVTGTFKTNLNLGFCGLEAGRVHVSQTGLELSM